MGRATWPGVRPVSEWARHQVPRRIARRASRRQARFRRGEPLFFRRTCLVADTAVYVVGMFAGIDCAITARLGGERRGLWTWLALGAALASGASLVAVLSAIAGDSTTAAFYLGAAASAALLGGMCVLGRGTVIGAPME